MAKSKHRKSHYKKKKIQNNKKLEEKATVKYLNDEYIKLMVLADKERELKLKRLEEKKERSEKFLEMSNSLTKSML